MQLMPGTASKLGVPNAFDAQANVEGGTRYLRELLERYDFDLIKALAAYNAGPRRVEQYGGLPPYYETHAYVARIVKDFNRKKLAQKNAARQASPATAKTSSRNAAKGKPKNAHQRANPEVPLQYLVRKAFATAQSKYGSTAPSGLTVVVESFTLRTAVSRLALRGSRREASRRHG
jgi:membrane-bound lytic murein transglycosylase MltF